MKKIFLTALFLAMGTATVTGQTTDAANTTNGWDKMGESTLNLKTQTEEIIIVNPDEFSAVKLQVSENPILLESFDIHFANGEKQTVNYGGFDAVPLKATGDRVVSKITIRYKSMDEGDKRAKVALLGQKAKNNSNLAVR